MFTAVYTGMAGMAAFSKGLDTISNNVSNLNTNGYKGNEVLFADLFYGYQLSENNGGFDFNQFGNGVEAKNAQVNFKQGDLRDTGNNTDTAISGLGFFVVRDGETTYYTRNGQFEFDKNGYLVTKNDGYRVASLNKDGSLSDININELQINAPAATSKVTFTNNLSTGSSRHEVSDIEVIDRAGNKHLLKATFVNNGSVTPRSWIVEVSDSNGKSVAPAGEIRYQGNGSPAEGENSYTFTFTPEEGDPFDVTFFFGDPSTFVDTTSFAGGTTSDLKVATANGHGPGSMMEASFNTEGAFEVKYSNDETVKGPVLALARIDDLQSLKQLGGGLFVANSDLQVHVSTASHEGIGEIKGKSIELSNIELTDQFTNLIIVQRGYQASSQILTTANEMMQQLMDMVAKR